MTTSVARHRSTARKLTGSAAVLSLALLATTGGTFAGFSDSAPLTNSGGLETGSLALSLTEGATSITASITGLAPGDTIRRLVRLDNSGKGAFTPKLAVSAASTNVLTGADGLNLLVEHCSVAWSADGATCSGTTVTAYSGDLVGAARDLTGVTLDGNSTAHLRTTISMPSPASDTLAGLSTGALTFTYSGAFVGGQQR